MSSSGRLLELIEGLGQLGYYGFQISDMIEECIGTKNWKNISPETQKQLVEFLEERLAFAKACLKISNKK